MKSIINFILKSLKNYSFGKRFTESEQSIKTFESFYYLLNKLLILCENFGKFCIKIKGLLIIVVSRMGNEFFTVLFVHSIDYSN